MSQNVKFDQLLKLINEFSNIGISKGISRLYTEDSNLEGRQITVKNKKFVYFGSCSYLGLELDQRLKEAAVEAVLKYGTYFSCSRIYVSCGNYAELEDLLGKMYNAPILLTTNSSLGHHSVMPFTIGGNDMVVYDQQAHISMHELAYKLNHYGTGVTVLRHNRLDELEKKIEQYKSKYDKIWYVIDGVYSMFGDPAPIKEIISLLDKHKKLWLYVDDAHGMSWAGPSGTGYTLSQTSLHPKMVMGTSMAKGFGSCGGIFVFPDVAMRDKIKQWGGPLAYSGPQEPATVAAAIASAKIHLSEEIYVLQEKLQRKIALCNEIMTHYKVPLVSVSESPIFFVGCGLPKVGFNLVERLMGAGFYTNLGIFPAVPETCTGVRFTMTNHITEEDIDKLAKAIAYHHPKALADEGRSMKDVYNAFRKFTDFESRLGPAENFIPSVNENEEAHNDSLELVQYASIKEIDKNMWNSLLGDRGAFDYDSLSLFEEVFSGNDEIENNWNFFYYIVYNDGFPVIATFFTSSISKDDMLTSKKISEIIEEVRKTDPYYLTSRVMMMGCPLTNGDHLYIDRKSPIWKNAMYLLVNAVWYDREKEKANGLFFRDFEDNDEELRSFFGGHGFFRVETLDNNIVYDLNNISFQDFINTRLSKKKRNQLRSETLPAIGDFTFKVLNDCTDKDVEIFYDLYKKLKTATFALNTFDLPLKLFRKIAQSPFWEITALEHNESKRFACVTLSLRTEKNICPVIYGADKTFNHLSIYKKNIYHLIEHCIDLKIKNLYLGITASEAKRKLGALQIKQIAYVQVKDKYNNDLIDSMSFDK
ncbi:MAG: bifunctional aminotransferase class I/II-fold pyridoxal phosphate-dependent enzyme/GNAT family N-acetyltransferase [Bacteroidales bacterium]|nr:bifunctional aminotransferase class I/II-fold pyridoxal phosphate-dependent enzyme/GNAT family N-acetyltransferase [Bacteroidales bacterium]